MNLTEGQRSRLMKREELSPTDRRDNEFAIRNRLQQFLEFVPDANLILFNLPKDQLRKNSKLAGVLNDETVYGLLDMVFLLLNILNFAVANGTPEKPYVVKYEEYKGPFTSNYAPQIKTDEPFDLAREQAKLFAEPPAPQNKNYPMLRKMDYEEQTRSRVINEYILELVDHYQSDQVLLNKIHTKMMDFGKTK